MRNWQVARCRVPNSLLIWKFEHLLNYYVGLYYCPELVIAHNNLVRVVAYDTSHAMAVNGDIKSYFSGWLANPTAYYWQTYIIIVSNISWNQNDNVSLLVLPPLSTCRHREFQAPTYSSRGGIIRPTCRFLFRTLNCPDGKHKENKLPEKPPENRKEEISFRSGEK